MTRPTGTCEALEGLERPVLAGAAVPDRDLAAGQVRDGLDRGVVLHQDALAGQVGRHGGGGYAKLGLTASAG